MPIHREWKGKPLSDKATLKGVETCGSAGGDGAFKKKDVPSPRNGPGQSKRFYILYWSTEIMSSEIEELKKVIGQLQRDVTRLSGKC